jgi:hypothetical protein
MPYFNFAARFIPAWKSADPPGSQALNARFAQLRTSHLPPEHANLSQRML